MNAAVTQTEQVTIHNLDVVAGMVALWLQLGAERQGQDDLVAKCWDLKSAYKQLPLDDRSFDLDGHFVIYSQLHKKPHVYKQRVLPFGSVASVTAFIRCSFALWKLGVSALRLVWSMYFDDYVHLTKARTARHMDLVISIFMKLFGWDISSDKLCPYSTMCKVLGVRLDMSEARLGQVRFSNTESRREELIAELEAILERGSLNSRDCQRVRGRLQFATGQLFGRSARAALHVVSKHGSSGFAKLQSECVEAFELLLSLLRANRQRVISRSLNNVVHVYVDASFEPNDGHSGLGGVCYNADGETLMWFGCGAPSWMIDELMHFEESEKETVIFELECLALLMAFKLFQAALGHSNIVAFTDNEGVLGTVVRCWSSNKFGSLCARAICKIEDRLSIFCWYERVPSSSNPADGPSRGLRLEDGKECVCTPDFLREVWNEVVGC